MLQRPLLVGVGAVLGLAVLLAAAGMAGAIARPPGPPPAPTHIPQPTTPGSRVEEERLRAAALQNGRVIVASGPETMGSRVQVAGKDIQLAADAYVEAYIASVTCRQGQVCPRTPLYTIRQGTSRITISAATGEVASEQVTPGEEGVFDALKRQLP